MALTEQDVTRLAGLIRDVMTQQLNTRYLTGSYGNIENEPEKPTRFRMNFDTGNEIVTISLERYKG